MDICTTACWNLGIVPATVCDMTAYYNRSTKAYYWMVDTDHEYIHSKNNPNLVTNRYNFTNDELAKSIEEAQEKLIKQINRRNNNGNTFNND